LLRYLKI